MIKMSKILTAFVALVFCADAYAVQTVKKLGTVTSTSNAKPITTTQRTASNIASSARVVKTATPVTNTTATTSTARMPSVTGIKSIGTLNTSKPQVTSNSSAEPQPIASDVIQGTINRIEDLEYFAENAITDVTTTSGTYVTDIYAENNTLNVTKTDKLFAPVRNGSTTTDTAEIYISE